MGLIFGVARGAMLVSLAWFVMTITVKKDEYPELSKTAMTRPYIEKGAAFMASMAPDYFNDLVKPGDRTPALDKAIQRGEDATEESGASWQSMEELQRRMHEEK
jgi:hypothetical protein